ncbi:MAG: GNAT family N-acetyltransferase [Rhodospirillales bacterium]
MAADRRRDGVGTRLLNHIEAFALEQNAVIARLRTVEARDFYEKHGYTVYGVLEDRPIGTELPHKKKRLQPAG